MTARATDGVGIHALLEARSHPGRLDEELARQFLRLVGLVRRKRQPTAKAFVGGELFRQMQVAAVQV